ncbi:hypothetical protein LTR37_010260 [Vermiconidia calcicola]|uniref:Uncharacterized protein n=1 Tax=Vermiconidia calcicola TaxID=1690605 RepID=A0ACC3N595_9PEZI|nr:hypothetical protein LTR37_010260 [Vermiconidia calcicola]
MAAIQLNFSLRTSANCKTVHLLGSWDNYNGQLPLSKDASKAGGWKGTFRFQGATLKQGQRYWYYYIIDGYHVSHDPARESVTEPTTGRKLNTLDIPKAQGKAQEVPSSKASRQQRRVSSSNVPKGRSLSPSQIQSPKPTKPHETRQITTEQFQHPTVEQLAKRFAAQQLSESEEESSEEESDSDSDASSNVPSLSSRSSNSSTPSSVSSTSSCCTCERYGITRAGNRVKLDCGGSRCSNSSGSECSSESEDDHRVRTTRRQGVVMRK